MRVKDQMSAEEGLIDILDLNSIDDIVSHLDAHPDEQIVGTTFPGKNRTNGLLADTLRTYLNNRETDLETTDKAREDLLKLLSADQFGHIMKLTHQESHMAETDSDGKEVFPSFAHFRGDTVKGSSSEEGQTIVTFDYDHPIVILARSEQSEPYTMSTWDFLNVNHPGEMKRFFKPGWHPKEQNSGTEISWPDDSGKAAIWKIANYDSTSNVVLERGGNKNRRGEIKFVPLIDFLTDPNNMEYDESKDFTLATTPEEFQAVLRNINGIPGSEKYYTSASLLSKFNSALETVHEHGFLAKISISGLTRTGGFQETAERIL